jgi:hypothetical protein
MAFLMRLQMSAWVVISVTMVFGFFATLYYLLSREIVVGHEQEWKFIDMMFGGLVTVFGQIMHSWMTWFVGSRRVRADEVGGKRRSRKGALPQRTPARTVPS